MPSTKSHACAAAIGMMLSTASYAGLFGPSNYEECVLESMKGVTSDIAARQISQACRAKFSKKADNTALPGEVLSRLNGRAGQNDVTRTFSGSIYNGSPDWTITQLTLSISTAEVRNKKSAKAGGNVFDQFDKKPVVTVRDYNIDVTIKPLSSSYFSIDMIDAGENEAWHIKSGHGFRSK